MLLCLAEGCSNKEIAARLNFSAATVKLHVHNILRGLGLANRTAVALAARGLLRWFSPAARPQRRSPCPGRRSARCGPGRRQVAGSRCATPARRGRMDRPAGSWPWRLRGPSDRRRDRLPAKPPAPPAGRSPRRYRRCP
ncbi:response regulator transcription factor [Marinibaculum pumilum]|uniref:Response regulator transcription factor n=1 Tax=Marinibaculum pumilum TaxID=1766165 RepID=A0ABV7L541_9PROT